MNGIDLLFSDSKKLQRLLDVINDMSEAEAQGIMDSMDWIDEWQEDLFYG